MQAVAADVAAEAHHDGALSSSNNHFGANEEAFYGSGFWGHLARLPLGEAEKRLDVISGKFYGTGKKKNSQDLEVDCDDYSEPDLESSGGLMFDLEI